jgi:hypothetical protein
MKNREIQKENYMVRYERSFYDDGGFDIAYPEKILEFFNENKEIFKDIRQAQITCAYSSCPQRLILTKYNNDNIVLRGFNTGKSERCNKILCQILSECGFDVDEKYIKDNRSFFLKDKYDANNIDFNNGCDLDTNVCLIKANIGSIMKYTDILTAEQYTDILTAEQHKKIDKINKLYNYIVVSDVLDFPCNHMTIHNSGVLLTREKVFYLVGCDDNSDNNYIFIFHDNSQKESNLTIRYNGQISKNGSFSDLYNLITSDYCK